MSVREIAISVVIPTFERRDLVLLCVQALALQSCAETFEVIVVVDGSTDGTFEALSACTTPFPLRVVLQPNQGAAAARNHGARLARGPVLLFLDDDMDADPGLVAAHLRSHRDGVDAVFGHMPLHPDSPPTVLTPGLERWGRQRLSQLSTPGAELALDDYLTGQFSIPAEVFHALGGFDQDFTRGGTFGNEDVDFGYRLVKAGYRAVFAPDAVSRQRYVVRPTPHLERYRQCGHADVTFARKHPEQIDRLMSLNEARKPFNRLVARPLAKAPFWNFWVAAPRWITLRLAETGLRGRLTAALYFRVRALEYWRGVREAGGFPTRRSLRVLAYHAVADLSGAGVLAPYGVPAETLRRQLQLLRRKEFTFVTADEVAAFARGEARLPRRAVLVTFDDCYMDLAEADAVLAELGIGAVAFAVSGKLGGFNDWDAAHSTVRLPLLDAPALQCLEAGGLEIGAHSRTHPSLPVLDARAAAEEIAGSVDDLQAAGLRRPRFFAYPYGENGPREQGLVREAGLVAAFTTRIGVVSPAAGPAAWPRIEILRSDEGWRFLAKVTYARQLAWLAPVGELMRSVRAAAGRFVKRTLLSRGALRERTL